MNVVDTFLLYKFVRRLSTPFKEWDMFAAGVIDAEGNFLQPKQSRTPEQLASYSYFDVLVLNLKRLIAKVPGGSTRIATFAAALYMMREGRPLSEQTAISMAANFGNDHQALFEQARMLLEDGEIAGAPVNNVGDGQIADKKLGLKPKILKRSIIASANTQ